MKAIAFRLAGRRAFERNRRVIVAALAVLAGSASFAQSPSTASALAGLSVSVVDGSGTAVSDAVVTLEPLDGAGAVPRPLPAAAPRREVVQEDQRFVPQVTVVPVGATVQFPNRDKVQHHVYSLSKPKRFEIPLYEAGESTAVVFDRPGLVTLGCNIHDHMVGYIMVVNTPHYALTGADGAVHLEQVPPGRYRVGVWHPRARAGHEEEIQVAAGSVVTRKIKLTLKPERRVKRVPDPSRSTYP